MAFAGGETITMEMGGPVDFVNLQTTHIINQRARPPHVETNPIDEAQIRISQRDPFREQKIQRRTSKGGLRSLFSRNKMDKPTITPLIDEEQSISALPERITRAVGSQSIKRSLSLRITMDGTETPATPIQPASHIRVTTAPAKTPSKPTANPLKSPGKFSPRPLTRGSAAWDPPPLFQAYPQAIKHAQLSASTLSADSILRINNSQNNIKNDMAPAQGEAVNPDAAKKAAKSKSKHRRQISGSISKAEWTQKIFVLVTSGYLLQYAGDGSFDRLPEKMMQLGKDSVAFASDVIPGKHWVLQISQAMDSDGKSAAAHSRSLFSRLTFRGADYRRSATSLLLVLSSPEDMDQWLMVVRREIEALGGKKHVSETGKVKPDDNIMQLQAQPGHRYQVTRDPEVPSSPPTPRLSEFSPPSWTQEQAEDVEDIHRILDEAVNMWTSPELHFVTPTAGERSVTSSVVSHAEELLESLKDGSNRFSYVSSGQRTMITTEGSTPTASPTRASPPGLDAIPSMLDFKFPSESTIRPNSAAISDRRRSMQTIHTPTIDMPPPPKHYRHSTYAGTARNMRINAAPMQNFSVPNASGKPRSVQKTPVPEKEVPQISTPAPKRRESFQKGIPETDVSDVKDFRPLYPIQDTWPQSTMTAEAASKTPYTALPLTPNPSSKAEIYAKTARRRSSLMPLPLSRKLNTMQILRETKSHHELRSATSFTTPAPPRPSTPKVPCNDSKPLAAVANTKSKMRRPFSLQVSTLPSIQPSLKSPFKPTTPPSSLTLFPPTKPSANSDCASPAFNENGLLTSVTILSPSTEQLKKPKSPYAKEPRSSSALSHRKPRPPFLAHENSSSSPLRSARIPLPRQDSSTYISPVILPPLPSRPPERESRTRIPLAEFSPTVQVFKKESPKVLGTRRSLPSLVNGPPSAPPPDCALPPLPSPGKSGRASSFVGRGCGA